MHEILHRFALIHTCNIRYLGGYPIGNTHMNAWDRYYRSNYSGYLDEADWEV